MPDLIDERPRFYIEHDVIHDRVSGRHVTTNPTEYVRDENDKPLLEKPLWGQTDILDCLNLLNTLSEAAK